MTTLRANWPIAGKLAEWQTDVAEYLRVFHHIGFLFAPGSPFW
jgi:hypothetical protein